MSLIEHSLTLTPDELHCLTCAMAGNFPERFAPIRMDLLRKLAKAQHTNTRGAVAENERLRDGLRAALDYLELVPDDSVDYEAALIRVRDALGGGSSTLP